MSELQIPRKLNICIIANQLSKLDFTKDLAKNHNVTVIAWKNSEKKKYIDEQDVKSYFLGHDNSNDLFFELVYKKFKELHEQEAFHIVHSIDSNGILIGLNKEKYGVTVIYDVQSTRMSKLFSTIELSKNTFRGKIKSYLQAASIFIRSYYFGRDRKLLKSADGIFVTTEQQQLILRRYYFYPKRKIHVIPVGRKICDLSKNQEDLDFKNQLGLSSHPQIVMTLTEMVDLHEIKNILVAFEKLAIKKPRAHLVILGNGPKKKEIEYEMLMRALGSKVSFVEDFCDEDLPKYISLADVFVSFRSSSTNFEPSLLEAMTQEKIIISSEINPIASIVEHGKNGFLIRSTNTNVLSSLLIDIFSGKIAKEDIGQSARKKLISISDTEKIAGKITEAYREILLSASHYKK